jgi:hypothetical protein
LGVIFMIMFRVQIGRFLDRTKSVGKEGLRAYDEAGSQTKPVKADAITQFLEGYHSPLLLELEAAIDQEATNRGLTNTPDMIKALRKSLAGALIARLRIDSKLHLRESGRGIAPPEMSRSYTDAAGRRGGVL